MTPLVIKDILFIKLWVNDFYLHQPKLYETRKGYCMRTTPLQQAISAIRLGDNKTGEWLLTDVLKTDPNNEVAWLWMAEVAKTNERRREYLERVLEINPENKVAAEKLQELGTGTFNGAQPATSDEPKETRDSRSSITPTKEKAPKRKARDPHAGSGLETDDPEVLLETLRDRQKKLEGYAANPNEADEEEMAGYMDFQRILEEEMALAGESLIAETPAIDQETAPPVDDKPAAPVTPPPRPQEPETTSPQPVEPIQVAPPPPPTTPVPPQTKPALIKQAVAPTQPQPVAPPPISPYWGGLWVIIFALITVGLVFGLSLPQRWGDWRLFAQGSNIVIGEVISTGQDQNNRYHINYQVNVPVSGAENTTIEKDEIVSEQIYNLLVPGAKVKVQYLFNDPTRFRLLGQDSLNNLLIWSVLALLSGIATLLTLLGTFSFARQAMAAAVVAPAAGAQQVVSGGGTSLRNLLQIAGGGLSLVWTIITSLFGSFSFRRSPSKKTATAPEFTWEGEGAPIQTWTETYTLGQNSYISSQVIENEAGSFLGEGGMEIFKSVPDTDPKQIIAFDVGIFDSTDNSTLSKIIMTPQIYNDETMRLAVDANPDAEAFLTQPNTTFTLETTALRLEAQVKGVSYDADDLYFEELTIAIGVFAKAGVDFNKPMLIPVEYS